MFQEPTTDRIQKDGSTNALASTKRSIFRSEARQRYIQNQEKMVQPRLVSPLDFEYLWILALILMLAGSIIAFWPLIW